MRQLLALIHVMENQTIPTLYSKTSIIREYKLTREPVLWE